MLGDRGHRQAKTRLSPGTERLLEKTGVFEAYSQTISLPTVFPVPSEWGLLCDALEAHCDRNIRYRLASRCGFGHSKERVGAKWPTTTRTLHFVLSGDPLRIAGGALLCLRGDGILTALRFSRTVCAIAPINSCSNYGAVATTARGKGYPSGPLLISKRFLSYRSDPPITHSARGKAPPILVADHLPLVECLVVRTGLIQGKLQRHLRSSWSSSGRTWPIGGWSTVSDAHRDSTGTCFKVKVVDRCCVARCKGYHNVVNEVAGVSTLI